MTVPTVISNPHCIQIQSTKVKYKRNWERKQGPEAGEKSIEPLYLVKEIVYKSPKNLCNPQTAIRNYRSNISDSKVSIRPTGGIA